MNAKPPEPATPVEVPVSMYASDAMAAIAGKLLAAEVGRVGLRNLAPGDVEFAVVTAGEVYARTIMFEVIASDDDNAPEAEEEAAPCAP
jgi:hypothetical protein